MSHQTRLTSQIDVVPNFEYILESAGWGAYSKFMLGVFSCSLLANAAVFASVSFAIPLSTCDLIWDDTNLMMMHLTFTVGRAFIGFFLHCACDMYGRKRIMSFGLLIVFFFTFAAAFSHSYITVIIMALILGSGLEATRTMAKVHVAEILLTKNRGLYLVLLDMMWTIGYLLVALFAIYMKELAIVEHRSLDMRLTTWRILFAISGGLNLLIACTFALLEESPRFLLSYKKDHLALLILKQFFTINTSSYSETFGFREQQLSSLMKDYNLNYPDSDNNVDQCIQYFGRIYRSFKVLLNPQFMGTFVLLTLLQTSKVFEVLEMNNLLTASVLHPNSTITGRDIFYFDLPHVLEKCNTITNSLFYKYFLLIGVNALAGQTILLFAIDRIGRKYLIFGGLLLTGICCAALPFTIAFRIKFAIASTILFTRTIAYTCISIVGIESFPTGVRTTAAATTNFYSIVLSLVVIRYLSLDIQVLFILIASVYLCTSILALLIKDLNRKPMIE